MMEALELREVDESYAAHRQAFLNFAVKAEKKVGKNKTRPVYRRFEQFFDYEKEVDKVKNRKESQFKNLKAYLRKKESDKHG